MLTRQALTQLIEELEKTEQETIHEPIKEPGEVFPPKTADELERDQRRQRLEEELEARDGQPKVIEIHGYKPPSQTLQASGPCATALKLVYGDRHASYGEPLDDMGRTAQLWSALLGVDVTAEQVAMCMICVKLSRLAHQMKADSVVDICGYAETIFRMQQERERRRIETHDDGKLNIE